MREIKFRARRIDNGRWVYGQYFKTPLTDENSGTKPDAGWFFLSGEPRHCIVQNSVSFVVDVKTLGQYTGLKDRNGKEIYEADVVKGTYEAFNVYFQEYETISFTSDVQWINTGFGVKRKTFNDEGRLRDYGYQIIWDADGVEVIGSVFENPNWESGSHEVD